jgi:receptor protein-tyrosine kinase
MSISQLRNSVQTSVDPASNLVNIQASAGSATRAAQVANQFAKQSQKFYAQHQQTRSARAAQELQGEWQKVKGAGADPDTRKAYRSSIAKLLLQSTYARPIQIAHTAATPSSPSSPKPLRDTILGAILGLILGIVAAFAREAFDRRFNDADEVQQHLSLPLVGYVPDQALGEGVGVNGTGAFTEQELDAFRILRSNVNFLDVDRTLGSILVTSAVAQEGKSTVAAGIAYANSVAGRRTLLVECDLRRPVLAERLGVAPVPGLVDYLAGEASPREVVQVAPIVPGSGSENSYTTGRPAGGNGAPGGPHDQGAANLVCITSGSHSPHPTEMLGSQRFSEFLDQVGNVYDLIVLDSAPLLPVGDSLELIPGVDGVLVCVRLRQTTREQALACEAALERFPSGPIGVVVTGLRPGRGSAYYGGYQYGGAYRNLTRAE